MNATMAKGLPESFLSLDDSGTLSSKQRQRKCFTVYYSKYYCKAKGRRVLRCDDHAVMVTDTDFVSGWDAVFVSFHSFVLWRHVWGFLVELNFCKTYFTLGVHTFTTQNKVWGPICRWHSLQI